MKNIHLIKTDKPSRLIIYSTLLNEYRLLDEPIEDWKHKRHIYITNEEEIKDGDYWIYICPINGLDYGDNNNPIVKNNLPNSWFNKLHDKLNYKKIILTTDQDLIKDGVQSIDDDFLEWFVKNSSCKRVEIRYTVDFNSKAVIIIPKEEPKQVTLEEVAEEYAISKSSSSVFQKAHIRDFIAGAKWQQERMYSENDLKEAFKQSRRTNIFEIGMPLVFDSFEDWFKQYKK